MDGQGVFEAKKPIEGQSPDKFMVEKYEGAFSMDKAHGKGKMEYFDGRVY